MKRRKVRPKLRKSERRKLKVLSLFTGAGGLDIGLEAAGFSIALSVEFDEDCRKTLSRNRRNWKLANPGDIHKLSNRELLKQLDIKPKQLSLLSGGPPCQPFSKSGYWVNGDAKRLSDPRATTLGAYIRVLEATLPSVVLLENVKGLVFEEKDEGFGFLCKELKRINRSRRVNYQPYVFSIDCANYGVPQHRERVFIVAHRDGKEFSVPEITHGPKAKLPYLNAWDALGDLRIKQVPRELIGGSKWKDLLPSIPEGENYLWHTPQSGGLPLFGWRTRYWSFLLKLSKKRPSWTIQATPGPATGPFHWANRKLTVRELCRLQTFPDDFHIVGNYHSAHRQIGNAVPPLIGELLGLQIRRKFLDHRVRQVLTFLPTRRRRRVPAQRRCKVPTKYHRLMGNHKPHPGHGLGPSAVKRRRKIKRPKKSTMVARRLSEM